MKTSSYIKRARQRIGWTQAKMGEFFETQQTNISKYERGETKASANFMLKLLALEKKTAWYREQNKKKEAKLREKFKKEFGIE